MKSIAQFFRAEWREYRGTLFGLWAALVTGILVAFFTTAQKYVTDPFAPAAFACLGYLSVALAVLPRVFRPEGKDPQRAFLRRTPGGLNHSFWGKFLFVYAGLILTALIPFLFTVVLMYTRAAANLQTLFDTKGDSLGFAMGVVFLHAAPLLLVAWGLSLRWLLLAVPTSLAMVYGSCTLAVNASYYALTDPARSTVLLGCAALVLAPWLSAWFAYRAPGGITHFRRWIGATLMLGVGLTPAWGLGVLGTINQIKHAHFFDSESGDIRLDDPYLSSNGRFVYSSVRTTRRDLPKANWTPHAVCIDLENGSVSNFGMGSFQQLTAEGIRHHDGSKFPRADELLLLTFQPQLPWMLHQNSGSYSIATDSCLKSPLDFETVLSGMRTNAEAFGLPYPWRATPYAVGLGVHLNNNEGKRGMREAIYDRSRSQVFHVSEFPAELKGFLNRRRFKALPGPWLVPPVEIGTAYRLYDPVTKRLEPSGTLTGAQIIGPALADGRVLVRNGTEFALYDSASDGLVPLESQGAIIPLPKFKRSPNMMLQEYFALDHLVNTAGLTPRLAMYDVRTKGTNPNGPMDRYLGWINPDEESIRWLAWDHADHVFGILDDRTILYTEDSNRIMRLDLETGKSTCLFPFPQ